MDWLNYRKPGDNSRKVFQQGVVSCSLEYDNDGNEVAKFFTHPRQFRNAGIFVIALSAVHKYADDKRLIKAARFAANLLGLGNSRDDMKQMADFMNKMIIELVTMKPLTSKEFEDDMGTIERADIRDDGAHIEIHANTPRIIH